jgi:hypothetical protein
MTGVRDMIASAEITGVEEGVECPTTMQALPTDPKPFRPSANSSERAAAPKRPSRSAAGEAKSDGPTRSNSKRSRKKPAGKTPPVPGSRFYYVAWQEGEEDIRHNAIRAMTMTEANESFRRQYPTRKVLGLSLEYPRPTD